MKILTKKSIGEKVVGKFTCKTCESEMEVQIQDCDIGRAGDYSGDYESYCGFRCAVCNTFIDVPMKHYETIGLYKQQSAPVELTGQK